MAGKGGGDRKKGGSGTGKSRKKTDTGGAQKKQKGSAEKELIKQLSTILKELDEEGLRFLLQQALVLQHNMQVQKLQEELRKTSGKSEGKKKKAPQAAADDVDVKEGEDGSHFIIIMRNYRNFFDRGEMKKIVQICHASSDAGDAARRLFNWFAQNRKDVLNNSSIHEGTDPVLSNMYTLLINRYTVKED